MFLDILERFRNALLQTINGSSNIGDDLFLHGKIPDIWDLFSLADSRSMKRNGNAPGR